MAKEVIILLFPVVGGFILGFLASYLTWKRDISYRRRLVARAFYEEISRLEDVIGFYSKAFKTGEGLPPEWNARTPIRITEPFYEHGFFFALIREIFSLRGEAPLRLVEFYSYILRAERYRSIKETEPLFAGLYDQMKNDISNANALIPTVKKLLKKECR